MIGPSKSTLFKATERSSAKEISFWRVLFTIGLGISSASVVGAIDVKPASSSPSLQEKASSFDHAKKLFEKYCFECHGDGMSKGKVALDEMLNVDKTKMSPQDWEKVWKIVRHEFMPPADADRPSEDERRALIEWIEQDVLGVNYETPDPGRVTIRRLNRIEYEYTVNDLFSVQLNKEGEFSSDSANVSASLRDMLPPDDTAFGFDNIGDFQSLSPALLEKFFDIAEFVVDKVIAQDGPRVPELDVPRPALKVVKSDSTQVTDHTADFEVPHAGKYVANVQFLLGGWQEFGGNYDVVIKVNDYLLAKDAIEVGGYKNYKYSGEVDLSQGKQTLFISTVALKADATGKLKHLELKPKIKLSGPIGAGIYEYPESHKKVFFQGEAPKNIEQRRAYARSIVKRVADRAFRRPADAKTIDRLTEIVMRNDKFERGVGQALTAILTSPRFLFRAEMQPQPDDPKFVHSIDEFALASRLSYLLWLSLPDEELTKLAAEGKLRSNLDHQVKRMLADKKSERFFEDFAGQWLRTRNVLMTSISRLDTQINPVRGSMKRETEMLFEHIARNDRDLIELVTADYTFVDKKLADFYGLKDVDGEGFQKVNLSPDSKRGGILTHGSFLVSTSNPNRTSPVKRGLFVLENLLATEPPPPPPNIPPLDEAKAGEATPKTVREQLAIHRENKSCAACHAHFDPIGVVLENYDVIGRWREKENGEPIDPNSKTVTGQTLSGIQDLRNFFADQKDKFYRCASEKLLTYALGRGLDPHDAVTVDRIAEKVKAENGKFSTLLMAVVESPAFQMRRGDNGEKKTAPRLALPEPPPPDKRRPQRRRNQTNQVVAPNVQPATDAGVEKPEVQKVQPR